MNLVSIARECNKLNLETMKRIRDSKETILTMVMLSFRRPYRLIPTLINNIDMKLPMNLVLRVQGAEELTPKERREILALAEQFAAFDIQFTHGNYGTGIPRADIINRALTHFNTKYIITADDDMIYKKNALIANIAILEDHEEYGAISHWCTPGYNGHKIIDGVFQKIKLKSPFIDNIDTLGSGTAVFRTSVYETSTYDSRYTIGCADFDFCLQMRTKGWKLGIICIDNLKSKNDYDPTNKKYTKVRYDKKIIKESIRLFKEKWGYNL